jgi:phosphoserine phosphatase
MLDSKIDMIRKKEGIIADLKRQMQEQRKIDLDEVASLRKRLADTGETTLSKMHEIVAKANSEVPLRAE